MARSLQIRRFSAGILACKKDISGRGFYSHRLQSAMAIEICRCRHCWLPSIFMRIEIQFILAWSLYSLILSILSKVPFVARFLDGGGQPAKILSFRVGGFLH